MLRRAVTRGFLIAGLILAASGCEPVDYKGPRTITPRMDLAPEDTEHYRALLIGKWYLEQPRSDVCDREPTVAVCIASDANPEGSVFVHWMP